MTPIQQLMLGGGGGGGATTTYVDDIFSTFLYKGNASDKTITNGIDLAGEGGLTWIKRRNGSSDHALVDTVRGASQYLSSNSTAGNVATGANNNFNSFTSTGFTLKDDNGNDFFNKNNTPYSSWSFRKAPGFYDVVTYSGNGSNQNISHSLGCVPGFVMIKATSISGRNWSCWHKSIPKKYLLLNSINAANGDNTRSVTSSTYEVFGNWSDEGSSGVEYVAYLFAGGASTAATARSVDFDGSSDYLSLGASSDLQLGTGDFTVEGWFKYDDVSNTPCIFDFRSTTGSVTNGFAAFVKSSTGKLGLYTAGGWICDDGVAQFKNQWYHFAAVKSSGTIKLYINGTQSGSSYTTSTDFTNNTLEIGAGATGANTMYGWISNFRVVKGTALYTSSFRPPTEPLTNITNTKLLCCNNSSTTGSTVTPGTITANGTTASTDSPFDDPAAFTFGDAGDQNVIKCGSYVGNGSTGNNANDVNLGFEPQWLLIKSSSENGTDWMLLNSMSGIPGYNGYSPYLRASTNDEEKEDDIRLQVTSTGFSPTDSEDTFNKNGETYIYIAIRRPDGYVGKPSDAGTDVFNIDLDGTNSGDPSWVSGFPVDMQFIKDRAGTTFNWFLSTRLTQGKYLSTQSTAAEVANSVYSHDYQNGWGNYSSANGITSWMWKRSAGMDVVTYTGAGNGASSPLVVKHGLARSPNMIWVKNRTTAGSNWFVYHSDLGVDKFLILNLTNAEFGYNGGFSNITDTSISLFDSNTSNNKEYIAMLFASVDGISKVGSYTGNGTSSSSTQTITTGFQPRFMFLKNVSTDGYYWQIVDTTRGWTSTSNKRLYFNDSRAQDSNKVIGEPLSTGFTVTANNTGWNLQNEKYIYYAHA